MKYDPKFTDKSRQTYFTKILRETRQAIGQNIHDARVKEKMTLRKLSQLTGIPEHSLDQYELGKGEIRLDEVLRVKIVLNK